MTEKRGIIMDNNESHEIFKRKCKIVALCKRKNQTAVDIAKYLGLNVTTIHHQLRELVQDGHLFPTVRQGNQKNVPKYRFVSYGKYKYNEASEIAMERRNKALKLMQEPMTIPQIALILGATEDLIQADFQYFKNISKVKLHSGKIGGRGDEMAKWIARDNYILTMQTEKVIYDDEMPDALRRMFGFDKSILNGLKGTMRRVHETIHPAPLKKLEYRGVASCAEMI